MIRIFLVIIALFMTTTTTAQYAPINGIKMYYEIRGTGNTPLVLIHGGGSTIETNYATLLPLLSGYGKIIAVEMQAHGRTTDRGVPETYKQDAADIASLLKYLHIEKANILGFSDGGCTTLQFGISYPSLVNKLIIISSNYSNAGMIDGFADMMQHASLDNMPAPLKEGFLKVTPDKARLQIMFERDKQRRLNFPDFNEAEIKTIKSPVLLMVADKDVIKTEHVVQLSRLLSNSRLVVLPGTHGSFIGEVCTAEKDSHLPEMTALLIKEFLTHQ
jgi:pimeloyl-ACP methyl ester carboxylesterase